MRALTNILCAVVLLVTAGSATGQISEVTANPDVSVKAYLKPEGDIYVGQTVRLWVEVSSSGQFSQAPKFPDLKLKGAICLLPEQLGVNFTTQDNGQLRTGQRQRYVIIPGRPGSLQIPPIPITVNVSHGDDPATSVVLQTSAIEINVIFPPGAEGIDQIISVEKLTIIENYNRSLENFMVGDALERSVTIEASNTFALALPQTVFVQIDGSKVYPKQPELVDKVNRGQYLASRRDTATYVFEQETDVTLPEINISWWDPVGKNINTKTLPSVSFHVSENPNLPKSASAADSDVNITNTIERWLLTGLQWVQQHNISIGITALGLYILQLVWVRYNQRVVEHWWQNQARRLASEKRAFSDFGKECRSGDEQQIHMAFWRWIDRAVHKNEVTSLNQLALLVPNSDFIPLAQELAQKRFNHPYEKWNDMRNVYQMAKQFRRELISQKINQASKGVEMLNP